MTQRLLALTTAALLMFTVLLGTPSRVSAVAENWSFESSSTDGGWQIAVQDGSAHVEGDCTDSTVEALPWLDLDPQEGACFVQFSQMFPTAFALYHALPGGGFIALRHLDTTGPFVLAVDEVTYDDGNLQITYASENFDGDEVILDNGPDAWSLGDAGQKMAIYLLTAEPADWFDIDPSLIEEVLLSPEEMEVDSDGHRGDGDTDGEWVTKDLDLSGNCGTLDATVCPTITDAGSGKLIGAPGSAAMSTPARYTWLSCRVAGGGTTSRPSDCRAGKTVTSTGARFSRMAYRISLADRRSGYLRLAVQVRGTTYYSGTFDVRP